MGSPKPPPKEAPKPFDWLANGFLPTGPRQTNGIMLKIARHLLDLGEPLTLDQTTQLIHHWFDLAPPEFTPQPIAHYHEELLMAIANAKVPLSKTPLQCALDAPRNVPEPKWVSGLPTDSLKLVAVICTHLQEIAGPKPFFLSSYDLAKATGLPQRTAHAHLTALRAVGLKLVRKGNQNLANEYLLTPTNSEQRDPKAES